MQKGIKKIVYCAMLIAFAVVIKLFLGIPIITEGVYAISISLAPAIIIFAGMLLGPVYGGIAGFVTDILTNLIRPIGPYMPQFSLTMALYGILGFLFYTYLLKNKKIKSFPKMLIISSILQVLLSIVLNTYFLVQVNQVPLFALLPMRLLNAGISAPVFAFVLYVFEKLGNKIFTEKFALQKST